MDASVRYLEVTLIKNNRKYLIFVVKMRKNLNNLIKKWIQQEHKTKKNLKIN